MTFINVVMRPMEAKFRNLFKIKLNHCRINY